jgi:adenylate cyclase
MKLFSPRPSKPRSNQLARLPEPAEEVPDAEPDVPQQASDTPPEPPDAPREAIEPIAPLRWRFKIASEGWKLEATALLVAMLVALTLVPQVLNFARRDDYERQIHPLAPGWQTLESIEGRLYDARFSSRGAIVPKSAESIAIVAIDQRSLSGLAQWPWPREWHAKIIRRLRQAGARAIVFDVNFSGKQNPLSTGELSASDKALVAASEEAGNVLFPAALRPYEKEADASAKPGTAGASAAKVNEITPPFDELDLTTPDIGFNWLPANSSGETRRYAWRAKISGAPVASLSALAVGLFEKKLDGDENKAFFQVLESNRWKDTQGRARTVPLWESAIGRDDRAWTTQIFFWGSAGTFATHSYIDLLQNTSGQWSPEALKSKFNGRIVFIGATAGALNDVFGAPRFISAQGESGAPQISGVELHASVAAQMLDGRWIYAQETSSTLGWLFGMCAAGALWIAGLRNKVSRLARQAQKKWSRARLPGRIHTVMWLGLYAGLGGLPAIAFWGLAQWQFSHRDVWMAATYPLLGGAMSSVAALLLFFGAEAGERRKLYARLKSRCSPDVLDELLANPDEARQRPYTAEITVLFTDLEGFTYFSKTHDPEEVVEALNGYMTRMVQVVYNHGGTVDKFIGDAVMAFFGAPIPRYDHAAQALACAVAMQDACTEFRRETGILFFMRVGIHSGRPSWERWVLRSCRATPPSATP